MFWIFISIGFSVILWAAITLGNHFQEEREEKRFLELQENYNESPSRLNRLHD